MPAKLGITASRKFGKAHIRNRFKRIVREAFRLQFAQALKNISFIARPKPEAKSAKMADIQKDMLYLTRRIERITHD